MDLKLALPFIVHVRNAIELAKDNDLNLSGERFLKQINKQEMMNVHFVTIQKKKKECAYYRETPANTG